MGIFPYLEDVIRLNVVSADRGVCPHVAVGVVVEALGPCRLVVLLLPPQHVELLHLMLLLLVLLVLVVVMFLTGADLRVVGGTEAVVGDELLARTAVPRLAGELDIQPAVAGGVGLLELPNVVVRRQVVVAGGRLLLLPGGLPGAGGPRTVALLSQTPAH